MYTGHKKQRCDELGNGGGGLVIDDCSMNEEEMKKHKSTKVKGAGGEISNVETRISNCDKGIEVVE